MTKRAQTPGQTPEPRSRRSAWSIWAVAIGLLLLAAALLAIARDGPGLAACWAAARGKPAGMIAAMLLLPLVHWAATTASFWVFTRRYGRVGVGEMGALIGSAWLLGYLPLGPGMIGRVAYHKRVNGIPVTRSVLVTGLVIGTGVVAMVIIAGALVALSWGGTGGAGGAGAAGVSGPGAALAALVLLVPVIMLAATVPWGRRGAGETMGFGARCSVVVMVKLIDMGVWTLRYALAFSFVGRPIDATSALALATLAQFASLLPVQIGVSEWLSRGLAVWLKASTPTEALAAALVNRAAEVAMAIPVGAVSTYWLYRRTARLLRQGSPAVIPLEEAMDVEAVEVSDAGVKGEGESQRGGASS